MLYTHNIYIYIHQNNGVRFMIIIMLYYNICLITISTMHRRIRLLLFFFLVIVLFLKHDKRPRQTCA